MEDYGPGVPAEHFLIRMDRRHADDRDAKGDDPGSTRRGYPKLRGGEGRGRRRNAALIKKNTKFSSYIRKFRWDRLQSHIRKGFLIHTYI